MKLTADLENYILTWGELATHWGLNRTEAQIHALLFLTGASLTMEEISQTLDVARSNVSTSLKELLSWRIIKMVSVRGSRRKHYVAILDAWEMFRSVVYEQRRRNIDPFIGLTRETQAKIEQAKARTPVEDHALRQIGQLTEFLATSMGWYARLQAMSTATIRQYMKVGSKMLGLRKLL